MSVIRSKEAADSLLTTLSGTTHHHSSWLMAFLFRPLHKILQKLLKE